MQKLLAGIERFQQQVFEPKRDLFTQLASGQQPRALFVTCSDSRVDPCLLTQTDPGELFVLRNAGNLIPRYEASLGGEAGTIEYAIRVLKIPHVIVCGHSQCGAMAGLLQPETTAALPAVRAWLTHASEVRQCVDHACSTGNAKLPEKLNMAIRENVLTQLANLQTHPAIAEAMARDALTLHGWVYEFETGTVHACRYPDTKFCALNSSHAGSIGPRPTAHQ